VANQRVVHDFSSRVVLVTGATGGLGPQVIRAFLAAGAVVAGVTSQADKEHEAPVRTAIADLEGDANDRFTLLAADATDEQSVAEVVKQVGSNSGRVDILVNGIGGFHAGEPVTETPLDAWQGMFDLNVRPTFLFSRAVAKGMVARHWGRIINVSSRAAHSGRKNAAAYATAKNSVITLTEAQAEEVRDAGVTVNAILPSIIDTPANRAAMPKADTSKWPTPAQISRVVLFLASDDAELISGASIPVYGRS
jgi:NAD(P)-dependent dehydrogenase (short-subunit alcohol dehydrogenase family)